MNLLINKTKKNVKACPLVIHEFTTENGNQYIYDACSNYIYSITSLDLEMLKSIQTLSYDQLISKFSNEYSEKRVIESYNKISDYLTFDNAFYKTKSKDNILNIKNRKSFNKELCNVKQMTLELTQQCNLRCKYCIYGGEYKHHRIHSNNYMTWEVAQKSIDYFSLFINSPYRTVTRDYGALTFYGGEPLLSYTLIEKCVEYANQKLHNKVRYNFTTNGTLLDLDMIKFFIKYNFHILISLDGPQSEHDKHRVFKDGETGTFTKILKNLKLIYKLDSDYYVNKVDFITTYTPYTDLQKVIAFFQQSNPLFHHRLKRIQGYNRFNCEFEKRIPNHIKESHEKQIDRLRNKFITNLKNGNSYLKTDPIYTLFGDNFYPFINKKYINWKFYKYYAANCVPGITKFFVDSVGDYHICERVNQHFSIGNYQTGLDYKRIKKLIQMFNKNICRECSNCIAVYYCTRCFCNCINGHEIDKGEYCDYIKRSFINRLHNFYNILENNPSAFNPIN